tara:strand:- start:65 stop:235 length:171 start_codon:yes stop_codon:yes gene_type:complete
LTIFNLGLSLIYVCIGILYEGLYKEFVKHLKGYKVLKGNYLTVVKEIKRASSKALK